MVCIWEPDTSVLDASWEALDEEAQQRALLLATASLQTLTYGRVGSCPITLRPVPERAHTCGFNPSLWAGSWTNACPCSRTVDEVVLPGPVGYLSALIIDGVAVVADAGWDAEGWDEIGWDPRYTWADFRLDDGYRLVWQGDGPSPFPTTQDLNKPLTEPGTWAVVYSQSHAVSADGRIAVALLAAEFAKAFEPRGKCSLPKGVTSVVRNGVSFSIEAGLFPGGLTGNQIVDQFILRWAPSGSPDRTAQVFSPRSLRHRRTSAVPLRPTHGSI